MIRLPETILLRIFSDSSTSIVGISNGETTRILFWMVENIFFGCFISSTKAHLHMYIYTEAANINPFRILRLGTKGMCTLLNSEKLTRGLGIYTKFYKTKFYFRWMKNLLHTILGIFLTEIIYLSRMDWPLDISYILYRNRQRTLSVRRYFYKLEIQFREV